MNFFKKLKMALKKIKGKLIVAAVMVLVILLWGVAPLTVAISVSFVPIMTVDEETQEFVQVYDENGLPQDKFDWETFILTLGSGISAPWNAVISCFTEHFKAYMYTCRWFIIFYGLFVFIGVAKAFPKHEYEDIENGSSDWCENGEQYQVLSKSKGIILAEKNYLPTDKRGNVNVLVVRRFWCW